MSTVTVQTLGGDKGGADEGVLGVVKVKFVIIGLGKSTVVIRDGEQLTDGEDPSLSWVGIQLQLLLLLLLFSVWLAPFHSSSSSSCSCCLQMQVHLKLRFCSAS